MFTKDIYLNAGIENGTNTEGKEKVRTINREPHLQGGYSGKRISKPGQES